MFNLFGTAHILSLIVLTLFGIILIYLVRKLASPKLAMDIGRVIGVIMIVMEISSRYILVIVEQRTLAESLNLHFCGLSIWFVAIILIKPIYRLYEIAYFWGIAGASMALLTPDIIYSFPHFLNISFFFGHGLIVIGALYATFIYNLRPTLKSLSWVSMLTIFFVAIMIPVNKVLGTNYMYVVHKPNVASPVDFFGPWPWYIVVALIVAILMFTLLYLPFWIADKKSL